MFTAMVIFAFVASSAVFAVTMFDQTAQLTRNVRKNDEHTAWMVKATARRTARDRRVASAIDCATAR